MDLDHLLDNEFIYEGWIKPNGNNELVGMRRTRGWVDNQYIYFVAQFSCPFTNIEPPAERQAILTFDTTNGQPVVCKVGLSIVSEANARLNLEQETGTQGFDFDAIHQLTRNAWEQELNAITVEGGTAAQREIFYTALYQSKVVPNIFNDVNNEYRRHDLCVATLPTNKKQY